MSKSRILKKRQERGERRAGEGSARRIEDHDHVLGHEKVLASARGPCRGGKGADFNSIEFKLNLQEQAC